MTEKDTHYYLAEAICNVNRHPYCNGNQSDANVRDRWQETHLVGTTVRILKDADADAQQNQSKDLRIYLKSD